MSKLVSSIPMVLLVAVAGCGGETDKPLPGIDRREVATQIVTNVVLPTIDAFVVEAGELELAVTAWAANPTDTALRDAARAALAEAYAVAQRLEVMQIGPSGASTSVMGGQDLRAEIYAYELQNPCFVDAVLATSGYTTTTALAAQPVNRRGLAAIEYLLYYDGTASSCSGNPTLLSAVSDLPAARSAYATTAATLVKDAATRLRDAWAPTGGNFLDEVATAGASGSIYDSGQEALNALSDAIFYIEVDGKDMKVAPPAGIAGCALAPAPCPSLVESRYAELSIAHLRENALAFRQMFLGSLTGNTGVGFDDLLASFGQEALVTDILAKLDAIDAALAAIDAPLEQAVVDEAADVQALYAALQALTTVLKTSFVGLLDLQLPNAAAGDND